jgi:hypothetical protein
MNDPMGYDLGLEFAEIFTLIGCLMAFRESVIFYYLSPIIWPLVYVDERVTSRLDLNGWVGKHNLLS